MLTNNDFLPNIKKRLELEGTSIYDEELLDNIQSEMDSIYLVGVTPPESTLSPYYNKYATCIYVGVKILFDADTDIAKYNIILQKLQKELEYYKYAS